MIVCKFPLVSFESTSQAPSSSTSRRTVYYFKDEFVRFQLERESPPAFDFKLIDKLKKVWVAIRQMHVIQLPGRKPWFWPDGQILHQCAHRLRPVVFSFLLLLPTQPGQAHWRWRSFSSPPWLDQSKLADGIGQIIFSRGSSSHALCLSTSCLQHRKLPKSGPPSSR